MGCGVGRAERLWDEGDVEGDTDGRVGHVWTQPKKKKALKSSADVVKTPTMDGYSYDTPVLKPRHLLPRTAPDRDVSLASTLKSIEKVNERRADRGAPSPIIARRTEAVSAVDEPQPSPQFGRALAQMGAVASQPGSSALPPASDDAASTGGLSSSSAPASPTARLGSSMGGVPSSPLASSTDGLSKSFSGAAPLTPIGSRSRSALETRATPSSPTPGSRSQTPTPGTPGKAKIGKRTSHMNQLSYLRDSDSLLRANVAEPERLNLISPDDAVRMENPRQCEFNFSAMNDTTDFRMLADTMRRAGKFETEALIYYNMALDLDSDGEWTQAAAMYEKHLAVCQRMRDRQGEFLALNHLGAVAQSRGDMEKAITFHRQHLHSGDPVDKVVALSNLGLAFETAGVAAKAVACYDQIHDAFRRGGQLGPNAAGEDEDEEGMDAAEIDELNLSGIAHGSDLLSVDGKPPDSPEAVRAAALAFVRRGYLEMAGVVATGEAERAMRYERARYWMEFALALARLVGGKVQAVAAHGLGALSHAVGDVETAEECLEETLEVCDAGDAAQACAESGHKANDRNDYGAAVRHFDLAFRLATRADDPDLARRAKVALGVAQGNFQLTQYVQAQTTARIRQARLGASATPTRAASSLEGAPGISSWQT